MKTYRALFHPLRIAAPFAFGSSLTYAVPVAINASADLGVTENDNLSAASAFDSAALNLRYNTPNRNEVIALRFDLTGYKRSDIAAASVKLVNYKANSNHTLRLWGVNDNATGYNASTLTEGIGTDDNWPENGTLFSTTPGLEFDADSVTKGNRSDRSTDLGAAAMTNITEGSEVTLSTTALKDFLVNHTDNIVTILVTCDTVNSGQKQFASREATTLFTAGTPQPAGTYTPKLVIDMPGVRIPASADTQVSEAVTGNGSGSGTGTQTNARYYTAVAPGNNEILALRFDLTGYTPTDILGADVRLVNHRANSAATLHYYGVVDGSTGYNVTTATEGTTTDDDWPESGTVFGNMPGLEIDNVISTTGIRSDRTVDLGTTTTAIGNLAEGTKVVFSNNNLINFLKNHPDNLVTILVATDSNNSGQKRFGTKESTVLGSGGTAQPAGTYAPEINLLMANIDRDNDGLLNNWEVLHGLDPDDSDTDNDTIADGAEDQDLDFLTNLMEQAAGTDPADEDTDGDFVLDGYETHNGAWTSATNTGTNPLVADTDGDGLSDGVENPNLAFLDSTQTGTDPNLRDSDHDIYSDGAEIARGTDPTDVSKVPGGAVLELLGSGSFSLLGSALTDPENDISDSTAVGANFNWTAVTTTEKPFFGTGSLAVDPQNLSGAYDLFDHKVGTLNDKWLAGGVANVGGANTTVEFAGQIQLTHFTVASADDRPERDPVDWQILGSNDGTNFTPIFTQTDPARVTLWTSRFQVVKCTLAAPAAKYRFLRFQCTKVGTGENTVHLNEIEYFGTVSTIVPPGEFKITGFTGHPGAGNISLTWLSSPGTTYRVTYSASLTDAFPGVVSSSVPADAGSSTTYTFPNPQPAQQKLFFRVERP